MKFFQILFVSFFLMIFNLSFSQKERLSKKEIFRFFKSTVDQPSKHVINTSSNPWHADNTDNKYFTEDIIELRNRSKDKANYCRMIDWVFYKKESFIIGYSDHCNEPAVKKVTKPEDWIELRLKEQNSDMILLLFNNNKLVDQFQILSLEKESSDLNKKSLGLVMKLKRIR